MKKNRGIPLLLSALLTVSACDKIDDFVGGGGDDENPAKELRFIDEFIIPEGIMVNGTLVGGLSSIDYAVSTWYMISDDPNNPRFYTANLSYDKDGFSNVGVTEAVLLQDQGGQAFAEATVDPEALRVFGGNVVWASEGNVASGVNPFVRRATLTGGFINETVLDSKFQVSTTPETGPRQNGAFEGLSLSVDGEAFWVAMELPLQQDGPAPTLQDTDSPVRIARIDRITGIFGKEFAYELDPVARPAANGTSFELNGVVELLEYEQDKFLVLERSFSTGYEDGGNTVRIYDVDASNATDVSAMESLSGANFTPATKTLLFDFESIRDQLTDGIVDNIEGIAFGPDFENGNRSVVLVADNNFSAFGPQLNQLILLELR